MTYNKWKQYLNISLFAKISGIASRTSLFIKRSNPHVDNYSALVSVNTVTYTDCSKTHRRRHTKAHIMKRTCRQRPGHKDTLIDVALRKHALRAADPEHTRWYRHPDIRQLVTACLWYDFTSFIVCQYKSRMILGLYHLGGVSCLVTLQLHPLRDE